MYVYSECMGIELLQNRPTNILFHQPFDDFLHVFPQHPTSMFTCTKAISDVGPRPVLLRPGEFIKHGLAAATAHGFAHLYVSEFLSP